MLFYLNPTVLMAINSVNMGCMLFYCKLECDIVRSKQNTFFRRTNLEFVFKKPHRNVVLPKVSHTSYRTHLIWTANKHFYIVSAKHRYLQYLTQHLRKRNLIEEKMGVNVNEILWYSVCESKFHQCLNTSSMLSD